MTAGFTVPAAGYTLIAFFTGVVIYFTVLLKMTDTSYFSCVVFLSITVMHIQDANPYLFVLDRVLDTLIGVAVALLVNSVYLPRRMNRDVLYVSGLDDTILDSSSRLTPYSRVQLNRMIEQGMNFTVSTLRTPANVRNVLAGVNLKLPIIAMDGAVLYDMKENAYLESFRMDRDHTERMYHTLRDMGVHFFSNVLVDDMLVIYYDELSNEAQSDIYGTMHTSPYRNYVKRPLPEGEEAVYFMLIEKKDRIQQIFRSLKEKSWSPEYKILTYDSEDYPGYAYIKIYDCRATREHMLQVLRERLHMRKTVTFGSVEGKSDIFIKNSDRNEMVKQLKEQFEPVIFRKMESGRSVPLS